jgi:hypothetical protein
MDNAMVTRNQGTNESLFYEIIVVGDTITDAEWAIIPDADLTNEALFSETGQSGARVLVGPLDNGQYTLTGHLTGSSLQEYERNIRILVAPE